MKTVRMLVILVLVLTGLGTVAFSQPGQQVYIAYPVDDDPPVIDGVLDKGEYKDGMPLRVTFNDPTNPPGIIPYYPWWLPAPYNRVDLSYEFYAVYDEDNLYIAVDVMDDIVIDDGPSAPWHDDDVEIFVDGDQVGNDIWEEAPGKEGFQLIVDSGGDTMDVSGDDAIDWDATPGPRHKGYLIEFRISLASIDTEDGGGEVPPSPGDSIGFNIAVGDDDNGGLPYNWETTGEQTDTFGMWDGSDTFNEDDWGTLVFATDDDDELLDDDNDDQ